MADVSQNEPAGLDDFLSEPAGLDNFLAPSSGAPTNEDAEDSLSRKYGPSTMNTAKAFGLGLINGPTFNLGEKALTGLGITTPEEISQLRSRNAAPYNAGQVTGIGAAMYLAPEIEGPLQYLNAPAQVARLGEAASLGAKSLGVSSDIGLKAIGMATEGAFYGGANSVDEAVLGDPKAAAEHLMSNVGMGMLFGAGTGATFGALSKAASFASDVGSELNSKYNPFIRPDPTDLIGQVERAGGKSEGILEGLKKETPDAPTIREAQQQFGPDIPIFPGQIADSPIVQKAQSLVTQIPSTEGMAIKQLAQNAKNKITTDVASMFDGVKPESDIELGNAAKGQVLNSFRQELEPIQQELNSLGVESQSVPVNPELMNSIGNKIKSLDSLVNAKGDPLAPRSPEYRFVSRVAGELKGLSSVSDVDNYLQAINRETKGNMNLRYVMGEIGNKLKDAQESSILDYAKNMFSPLPDAEEATQNFLMQRQLAKEAYGETMQKYTPIAQATGIGKRIYGPQHLINHFEDMDAYTLGKKLMGMTKKEAFSQVNEAFPELSEQILNYQKGIIADKATQADGFSVSKAHDLVDSTPKELKEMLFNPDELRKMQVGATYLKSLQKVAKSLGPSGTPEGLMWGIAATHPGAAIAGQLTASTLQRGLEKFMNVPTYGGAEAAAAYGKLGVLSTIEKAIKKNTNAIYQGTKSVLNQTAPAIPRATMRIQLQSDPDKYKDFTEHLNRIANPDDAGMLLDAANKMTSPLHEFAPNISAAMGQTISNAVSALKNSIPVTQKDPMARAYEPSGSEKEKLFQTLDTIENPVGILNKVANGNLTTHSMATLQTVHPQMYSQMKEELVDQLSKMPHEKINNLPFHVKQSVSQFLGQPMVSALTPQHIMQMQSVYQGVNAAAAAKNAMPAQKKVPAGAKLKASDRMSLQPNEEA